MTMNLNNVITFVLMVAVFGFVLALWLMGVMVWHGRRKKRTQEITSRLHHDIAAEKPDADSRVLRLWKDGAESTTVVPDLKRRRYHPVARLRRFIRHAGVETALGTFLLALLGAMLLLAALVLSLTHSLMSVGAMSLIILLLIRNRLAKRADSRMASFENQFAEALELCARSLRAGHPLIGSFRIVADEMPPPVSTLFNNICQLQGLGLGIESAIKQVAEESESSDMDLFAMSVVIQLRSGGNLAEMMHKLASVIRDRMRLKKRVRVLTAQVQLSRQVLTLLPFFLLGLLTAVNPNYMSPLFHTSQGHILLVLAASSLALGIWIMNRIAVVRY